MKMGPLSCKGRSSLILLCLCCSSLLTAVRGSFHNPSSFRFVDILNHDNSNNHDKKLEETKLGIGSKNQQSNDDDDDDVEEQYFTQRLDHFDPTNSGQTYQQRYFVSRRYVSSPDDDDSTASSNPPLVFLCVGGEGPGFTKSVLVDSVHCTGDMIELASQLSTKYERSVYMFALEHRYYGKSFPNFSSESENDSEDDDHGEDDSPPDLTIPRLKYLSSRQALEDLANFVQSKTQEILNEESSSGRITDATTEKVIKWVTFGGSYPGYMAANARLKYPHLIYASVSNSAPLDLKVDFPQYYEKVGFDLRYSKIGGSELCYNIVKQGHQQAVSLLQENSTKLASMFNVCNPTTALITKNDQGMLLGDGLIHIPAQSNDPSCDGDDDSLCDIGRLCGYMTEKFADSGDGDSQRTELEILADVAVNKQRRDEAESTGCMTVDWQETLKELAKPHADSFGTRSWLWQTCTEFGFYQTCQEDCPYASFYHLVDMDLEICKFAYNITNVYENVQSSIDYYGGLDIASGGSRVLSVNGDVDPWSMLGLTESPKYSLPTAMVKGASHHFWTHPVKDTDSTEVQHVREYIYSVIKDWLDINDDFTYNGEKVNGAQKQLLLRGKPLSSSTIAIDKVPSMMKLT